MSLKLPGFHTSGLCVLQEEADRVEGKKPYKELKGKGPVAQQADDAWAYARSRSNSAVQDVFAGQLQSTLQCPHCHACSYSFDEFLDLSLQLPPRPAAAAAAGSVVDGVTVQVCKSATQHNMLQHCLSGSCHIAHLAICEAFILSSTMVSCVVVMASTVRCLTAVRFTDCSLDMASSGMSAHPHMDNPQCH